ASGTKPLVKAVDEEIERISEDIDDEELDRVKASLTADLLWDNDQIISRAMNIAVFEQIHGKGELVNDIGSVIAEIGPKDVVAIARKWLDPKKRAVLEWLPGAAS